MGVKSVFLNKNEEYLTLNVLLKLTGIISTGGMAKIYLATHQVKVNGEDESRRGRKLYPGDIVLVENQEYRINSHED